MTRFYRSIQSIFHRLQAHTNQKKTLMGFFSFFASPTPEESVSEKREWTSFVAH